MPSRDHDGVIEVLRREPKLVAELLGGALVELQPYSGAPVDSGDLTQVHPDFWARGLLLGAGSESRGLAGQEKASYPTFMNNVRDILDAIRGLPPSDRLRLIEELTSALESEPANDALVQPPSGSNLEIKNGFYQVAVDRCANRSLKSGSIFDALHLVAAERKGASVLLTFNPEDFVRLSEGGTPTVIAPPDPPSIELPALR